MDYYLKTNKKNELIINKSILLKIDVKKNEKILVQIKKNRKIIIKKINIENFCYDAEPLKENLIIIN